MKRYCSPEALCPFYRSEDSQKIYCEGIGEGNAIHLAFGSKTHLKIHKDSYCDSEYGECPIAKMLNKKYED